MKKQSYDIDPAAVAPQAPPTEEELAAAKETVKQERKQSRLAKASFAWTVISMLYAIVSGAVLISGKWILAPYSYIMAGLLGVYVVIFVVLVVSFAGDAKAGKKKIKTFKKLFGMFKIFTNIVFLIATAISPGSSSGSSWARICSSPPSSSPSRSGSSSSASSQSA